MAGPNRPALHFVGQQDQKALVVVGGAAEVVGELDEHGGVIVIPNAVRDRAGLRRQGDLEWTSH